MTPAVVSLPVSPRRDTPIGFYLTAAAVGLIARLTHRQAVLSVNLLGARQHTRDEADHYLEHASSVCGPAKHWIDSDADWPAILKDFTERGQSQGWLTTREMKVRTCSCGLLEYPADAPPNLGKRTIGKVYALKDGELHCLHCGSIARTKLVRALFITLPPAVPLQATPNWASKEAAAFWKGCSGRPLMISRQRSTGLSLSLAGRCFNIDPDLALMLLPTALRRDDIEVKNIVTGSRTIKQAVMAAMVSCLMGLPCPSITALPMLTFTNTDGSPARPNEKVIAEFGGATVRTVLAMAMGQQCQKAVRLPTRNLHLTAITLPLFSPINEFAGDISAPCSMLGKQKIETLLATIRRNRPLKAAQATLLQALCA